MPTPLRSVQVAVGPKCDPKGTETCTQTKCNCKSDFSG